MLRTIRLTLAIVFFAFITLRSSILAGHCTAGWAGGKNTIPPRTARTECGRGSAACCIDPIVRTRLLLRYLSARCVSGCHFPICRQTEEKPFPLLSCAEMAALWNVGIVCRCACCRHTLPCSSLIARTVQLVWPYRFQSFCPRLSVGQ